MQGNVRVPLRLGPDAVLDWTGKIDSYDFERSAPEYDLLVVVGGVEPAQDLITCFVSFLRPGTQ